MNNELSKSYDHKDFESEIYKFWENENYFQPEKQIELGLVNQKSQKFCITIPLPNVTGALHLGHAITISIEDLMTRYNRMLQKETLFIPGTDHAGIATQAVVERELRKQGINRQDLGRKKFIDKVWEWKDLYHARITKQSKSMGMSSDWSREAFTLDEDRTKAVREAFYRLYNKKLIYRGEYLINWCPGCESAISDLETIGEEKESSLWYIKYPITTPKWKEPKNPWGSGKWAQGATKYIIVATTRPETLLGDTAIATTKEHKEYGKLVGKKAVLPVNGRKIPIIVDEHVDPEFGTGALKITPGHDPNDYEIGKSHNLDVITVLDQNAKILPEHSGPYNGMNRYECRNAIVEDLKKEGLLVKIEPYIHQEPHCQRCNTVIEPRVSIQWFVKTKPLAAAAMEKVRNKETIIIPEREERRFFQWMENIHDWCISRQLWWGHRIPIWYCDDCNTEICPEPNVDSLSECPKCKSKNIKQEEDVLDTWFSSGLWPFSTLGWPNTESPDFKNFFPTTTRETGYDILFFWVAREMMMGIELTGKVPYKTVYLHGLIRDDKGKKISKSMEDIDRYDPLNIIKDFGADSLRYVLISNSVAGLDMNLDPRQLDAAHRFCNKIWQSTRFVLSQISEDENLPTFNKLDKTLLEKSDLWIISRLNQLIQSVNSSMDSHEYLKVARDIKNFFWQEFCDWYIEISKIRIYNADEKTRVIPKVILLEVLDKSLKLLHPIIPHMTEKLWQALPQNVKTEPALIVAKWPKFNKKSIDEKLEEEFDFITDLIKDVRRIRNEFNVPLSIQIPITIITEKHSNLIDDLKEELIVLAKINPEEIIITKNKTIPKRSARIIKQDLTAFIPLEGIIDMKLESERINKQLVKINKHVNNLTKKLGGSFSTRAPKEIVDKERTKLEELTDKKNQLEQQLKILK